MTTESRLIAYKEAELAILKGQEMRVGDRTWRRADLSEIRKAIKELESQVAREQSGSPFRYKLANLNRESR